jgi:hypothetical protein
VDLCRQVEAETAVVVDAGGAHEGTAAFMMRSRGGCVLELRRKGDVAAPRWEWREHGHPEGGRVAAGLGLAVEFGSVVAVTEQGGMSELRRVAGEGYTWVEHGKPPKQVSPARSVRIAEDGGKKQRRETCTQEGWYCICGGAKEAPTGGGVLVVRDDGALVQRRWVGGWFGGWSVSLGPATALRRAGVRVSPGLITQPQGPRNLCCFFL